ncbi:hypothetical protein QBC43DRAFT_351195 [Cladorrhinum sp. PSN259]|nr:hypothetical protein QBC43DRAFT_351195 [Cladorrhinum sp. PSN259]
MGQIGSLLSRSASRRHSARSLPSLFLELPADIIIYLCREHLRPPSVLALSLTCKSFLGLTSCHAEILLSSSDREEFLLLLERDVGHDRYYCRTCSVLHRFSSSERSALRSSTWALDSDDCRRRNLVRFTGSAISIGYHHKFQLERTSYGSLHWMEKWSARIFLGELFLSATRTLCWIDKTDQELRDGLDAKLYAICGHVYTARRASHSVNALHLGSSSAGLFTPCRNVVESCNKCLTDYDTTVEQRWIKTRRGGKGEQMRACWHITIILYHRLGGGRSPSDAKWHAFAARGFWDLYNISRDMIRYPQGAVRQVWKDAES